MSLTMLWSKLKAIISRDKPNAERIGAFDEFEPHSEAFREELLSFWDKEGDLWPIYKVISENPDITSSEVRERVGVSAVKLSYILKHLEELGIVCSPNYKKKGHVRKLRSRVESIKKKPYVKIIDQ